MILSPNQKEFLKFLSKQETATFEEAGAFFGGQYSNQGHYVSEALGRLVKRGFIVRVKKGVYKIADDLKEKPKLNIIHNQIKLL